MSLARPHAALGFEEMEMEQTRCFREALAR
jgi:hypothetical protein